MLVACLGIFLQDKWWSGTPANILLWSGKDSRIASSWSCVWEQRWRSTWLHWIRWKRWENCFHWKLERLRKYFITYIWKIFHLVQHCIQFTVRKGNQFALYLFWTASTNTCSWTLPFLFVLKLHCRFGKTFIAGPSPLSWSIVCPCPPSSSFFLYHHFPVLVNLVVATACL